MDLQKKLLREPPPRALPGDLTPRNNAEQSTEMALGGGSTARSCLSTAKARAACSASPGVWAYSLGRGL
eukprot:7581035-Pyramimonas_sp.AAC.1